MLLDNKAGSGWFLPFQDSCGCLYMVVAGFKWFLMLVYSIGCFKPV